MSLDIVTVGMCPQYTATFEVVGSKDNVYTATLDGPDGPYCSCPAFKYSGEPGEQNCKHLDRIREHGCLYDPQGVDAGPNDLADVGITITATATGRSYNEPCPGCGEDMIAVRIGV